MKDNNNRSEELDLEKFKTDGRHAIIGGILAALVVMGGSWMIGNVSNAEARYLLELVLPNVRSFSGNLMLALGTILALMLTLLGLSTSTDTELKWTHYQRVKQIAWLDMLTFIAAVLIYLLLNVPIQETDKGTGEWFHSLYYATLVVSSILAGAVITIILMLYNTVRDIIFAIGHPESKSEIIHTEEE